MNEPKGTRIIASIISLAHSCDMHLVAEGIETTAQLKEISELGCEYFQGFYFYKPLSADKFELLLKKTVAASSQAQLLPV